MSSPHEPSEMSPAVQRYLDQAAAPMRRIPAERRDAFLDEIRSHLESLIEEYEGEGAHRADAEKRAARMMGAPKKLGRSLVLTWYRSTEPGTVLSAIGIWAIVSAIIGAAVGPFMLAAVTMPVNFAMLNRASMIQGLYGHLAASVIAGWLAPRRAVPACAIAGCASFVSAMESLCMNAHLHRAGTPHSSLQWLAVVAAASCLGPGLSGVTAWLGRRARMYRRAGI